jgi:membrane protein implicated in regulation of membrane protease activity
MDPWVIWVIAACVFAAGEIATTSFFLGPFAVGAAVAAILAAIGVGWALSAIVFLIVSILVLLTLRPIARRHLRSGPALRTGTAALVGKTAIVLERVSNDEAVGVVRLEGEVWTARAFDEDRGIDAGEKVHVSDIRGATAMVD